jgi:hypothetical protein
MLSGESRTWVNGVELTDLHLVGLRSLAYQIFGIGFFLSNAPAGEAAHDVWIDDVVGDVQRVGCT